MGRPWRFQSAQWKEGGFLPQSRQQPSLASVGRRFGMCWQIVPEKIGETLKHPKAMAAMIKMVKFDIATLEAAAKEQRRAAKEPKRQRPVPTSARQCLSASTHRTKSGLLFYWAEASCQDGKPDQS
jgi:hypothetical protein